MRMIRRNRFASLLVAAAVVGCAEVPTQSLAPETAALAPSSARALISVTCSADIRANTVKCGEPASGDALHAVIVGGQGTYVRLVASNNSDIAADCPLAAIPDSSMSCYSFDVTLQNLLAQTMGTTDGVTRDSDGERVFFQNLPTSTGTGTLQLGNPDGGATFTAANQGYYRYDEFLPPGAITPAKTWRFQHTPDVTAFVFTVYVSTEVQYPDGYVDDLAPVLTMDPNESFTLTAGTVHNYLGSVIPGQTISYTSANPFVATASGSQVTAGATRGTTTLTAMSGVRPGRSQPVVDVCQSTVVTNGFVGSESVSNTDCIAALRDGSNDQYGDLYRVTLAAGQTITITVDTDHILDSYLVLADRVGNVLSVNDDDEVGSLGAGSRIIFTAATAGVYVFEVSTFGQFATGAYTLGVTIN